MNAIRRTLLAMLLLPGAIAQAQDTSAERYDIRVENAPARAFFEGLVDGTPINMVVHPDVKGSVTLSLKQVTIAEALDAASELYGYEYRPVARGYMVLPATIQSRIFQLNYLDVQRSGMSRTRVSSGQVTQSNSSESDGSGGAPGEESPTSSTTGTAVLTRSESDFWAGIEANIRALVASESPHDVVINRQAGVIVVRALPAQLRSVADYLRKTQSTVTRQVVLEAKIVEVELNSGFQAGINWGAILTDGNKQYFFGQQAPPNGFDNDPLVPTGQPVPVGPGNPVTGFITEALGGAFTFAIDTPDFNAFIELLDTQGRTRVLSSPRVSTLHNQKAVIKAGSDEFFVTGVKSDTTTGTSTTTSLDIELTPFFSGVALDVTPQIGEDGTVLLHIHPTVSEVSDQNKRVSFGGAASDLPLAFSQIRESDSVVRARSGQVIVIGGLMRETRTRNSHKTPLLGDVPGLGRLFRSERDRGQTVELVLLLRPLVTADDSWDALVREPLDRAAALAKEGKVEGQR